MWPRKRYRGENPATRIGASDYDHDNLLDLEDLWSNAALYAADRLPELHAEAALPSNSKNKRRLDESDRVSYDNAEHLDLPTEAERVVFEHVPQLWPSVPVAENRVVELNMPNPFFDEHATNHHPALRPGRSAIPADGHVNGLIKFRLRQPEGKEASAETLTDGVPRYAPFRSVAVHHRTPRAPQDDHVQPLPPNFGRVAGLGPTDEKLLSFYLVAFCEGRTLLDRANGFYRDIAPMAATSEYVRHALLALSATYVLDYQPTEGMQSRANLHFKKAVDLLGEALREPTVQEVGKEDAIIGALTLLSLDDCVNWELHDATSTEPKWYKGARTAKAILGASDPGYRYWHPTNVQCTTARIFCSNLLAVYDIFSQILMPLVVEDSQSLYPWLLGGTERDSRRINLSGLSAKCLHVFGQITHVAARLDQDPKSPVMLLSAATLERRLASLRQWSELSEGFPSVQALIDACDLDESGKVNSPVRVTELIAETYVLSAEIYLQCRVCRRPRHHPIVQQKLAVLIRCLEIMPYSGPLFTAQNPLLRPYIAGIVAIKPYDRGVIQEWFETVISGPRGNVPTAWKSLQDIWKWQDEELMDGSVGRDVPVSGRQPWWEMMAAAITAKWGRLNLA